ncbi:hypothetical protein QBC39DRAFT_331235 [Podospora conica]|nr:hypothetical protein QBC39DRAFT_331235 [Schizothecium conicum]
MGCSRHPCRGLGHPSGGTWRVVGRVQRAGKADLPPPLPTDHQEPEQKPAGGEMPGEIQTRGADNHRLASHSHRAPGDPVWSRRPTHGPLEGAIWQLYLGRGGHVICRPSYGVLFGAPRASCGTATPTPPSPRGYRSLSWLWTGGRGKSARPMGDDTSQIELSGEMEPRQAGLRMTRRQVPANNHEAHPYGPWPSWSWSWSRTNGRDELSSVWPRPSSARDRQGEVSLGEIPKTSASMPYLWSHKTLRRGANPAVLPVQERWRWALAW